MRLELIRLSPLPPQDSVSTNFTTSARHSLQPDNYTTICAVRKEAVAGIHLGIDCTRESSAGACGAGIWTSGAGAAGTASITLAGAPGCLLAR
mgnify:CR=1 FL=1